MPEAEVAERPNIVMILADDISAEDLGCYGNPGIKTPNLDQLAKTGIRFDNGFVVAASCAPSRGSIMTGRYPHATGMAALKALHRPDKAECLAFVRKLDNMAQELQKQGYHTIQSGKWHIGGLHPWNGGAPIGHFKQFFNSAERVNLNKAGGAYRWRELLQERPKDKPFFCWFSTFDAHRYSSKAPAVNSIDDVRVPPYLPAVESSKYNTKSDLLKSYNKISRADQYVGKVVDALKAQGVYENTLILFLSDNGRGFGRSKIHIHDSGVRVPFIAHWPAGIESPGRVSQSLVSSIDLAPTFLELVGGTAEGTTFQGRSFARLLKKDHATEPRSAVFTERNHHNWEAHERGVRTQRYLYIKNRRPEIQRRGSNKQDDYSYWILRDQVGLEGMDEAYSWFFKNPPGEELFDVKNDPHMMHDLASCPEHAGVLERLRAALQKWESQTGDTAPDNLTKHYRDPNEREYTRLPNSAIPGLIGEQPGWEYWKDKSIEDIREEAARTRSTRWIP